ncbi:MAG TPA: chemotaxis protein CheB, partial [Lysobacter sp.]
PLPPAPVAPVVVPPPLPPVSAAPVPPPLPPAPAMALEPVVEPVAAPAPALALEPVVETPRPPVSHEASYSPFDPVAAEASFGSAEPVEIAPELSDFEFTLVDAPADVVESDGLAIARFESSFDFEVADEAPRAAPRATQEPVLMFEASRPVASEPAPTPAPAAPATPAAPDWSFSDDTSTAPAAPAAPRAADSNQRFQRDLGDLSERISSLELVDDRPAVALDGAVLVLAGIGGPDAVRQLLGGLPEGFPRPVLVQQRLDGGRYDRLVAQMQRATPLQVRLAEPGLMAMPGTIYILPAEIGLAVSESGMRFTEGDGDVLTSLPSADSAVLMLSGSDPTRVDAAMNHSWAGALVAGQAPDGCYDATAASALIARGAHSGQPTELAARLAQRWH